MGQSFKKCLKEEFRTRNFLLNYRYPVTFTMFPFGGQKLYIVWRLFAVCLCTSLVAASLHLSQYYVTRQENRSKWLIYLTNWSLTFLLASAVTDLLVCVYVHCRRTDLLTGKCNSMTWYLKADWVLYNIACPAAFTISLIYWTMLYKPGQGFEGYKILPFLSHGINSVYTLAAVLLSGIPTRLLHFYQPLVCAVAYFVFSVIYHAEGGTNDKDETFIYAPLDWSHPVRAGLVSLIAMILCLAMHAVVFCLAFLRNRLASRYCSTRVGCISQDDEMDKYVTMNN